MQQLVNSSGQRTDGAFHLESEQQGLYLLYRKIGFYRQCIDLNFLLFVKDIRYLLFLSGQFGKERTLNRSFQGGGFPPYSLYKILSGLYQRCFILPDQAVTPLGTFISGPSRKGKTFTVVTQRHFGGNQRTPFIARLNHDRGAAHTRYNAVTADEIITLRFRTGKIFGNQSALFQHFDGRLPVHRRINPV